MCNRIFVSNVVPKDFITKLNVSAAANYFSYNLIEASIFDQNISLVPPNVNRKFKRSKEGVIFYSIIGDSFLKKSWCFLENIRKIFKSIKPQSRIWFYNLNSYNLLLFLILKAFKKDIKLFIILLDYTPSKNLFSISHLILTLINSSDGIISLTDNPSISHKKIVIPGFVKDKTYPKLNKVNYNFLLSGILSENRSPELILEAFSKFPHFNLIITGKIENHLLIDTYVKKCNNIKYLGFVEYDQYVEILNEASFSINSRNPKFEENHFNFPSKAIEHLSYNRIVISTMRYKELSGINYFYVKPNPESLMVFLKELELMKASHILNAYGNQTEIVRNKFGKEKWKESMNSLENLPI